MSSSCLQKGRRSSKALPPKKRYTQAAFAKREQPRSPTTLQRAVEAVQSGRMSLRMAQTHYGIKKSTIHDHASGKAKALTRGQPAIFTQAEEKRLIAYIKDSHNRFMPLTWEQVKRLAGKIVSESDRDKKFKRNQPSEWNSLEDIH